ncbi:MAG: zinc-ribbon domain-containing protein [Halobacteriota archaeon]
MNDQKHCSSCGEANPSEARFCLKCGELFRVAPVRSSLLKTTFKR